MADEAVREPDDIRRDCARKLRQVETGGMFTAILGCLLGEDWGTPKIEEMRITPTAACSLGSKVRPRSRRFWGPRPT